MNDLFGPHSIEIKQCQIFGQPAVNRQQIVLLRIDPSDLPIQFVVRADDATGLSKVVSDSVSLRADTDYPKRVPMDDTQAPQTVADLWPKVWRDDLADIV